MRRELVPLLTLAGPVVLGEIGWMSMGVVDTLMVAPLGPAAIGAAGIGSGLFTSIAIFGMGLMLGLDALVSRAHGSGDEADSLAWLYNGLWLAAAVAPLVMMLTALGEGTLDRWGLHAEIAVIVRPYLRVILLGAPPLLVYAAFRRYLQGLHVVRPVMAALVSANLVNAAGNWLLIYGNLGFPRLGVAGSAWATTVARCYMAAFLLVAIRRLHRERGERHPSVSRYPDVARLRRMVSLGLPAATQITLEVGVFAAATALAGRLDPVSSGSHQIALNVASLAFMVPLGIASAGAVRVGHAMGAGDTRRAAHAGWAALTVGSIIMGVIGALFVLAPRMILGGFSDDPRVLNLGTTLLAIAAAFQLFDGAQAITTGILRGAGDTRTPMVANVVGHWAIGLPVGYVLCFGRGWGVSGLWIGLSVGLVFVAIVLTAVWTRLSLSLGRGAVADAP